MEREREREREREVVTGRSGDTIKRDRMGEG